MILYGTTRVRRPLPIAGLAIVAGTLLAIAARRSVPGELLVAIVGIGAVCGIGTRPVGARPGDAVCRPLCVLLASTLDHQPGWLRVIVVVVASAGAVAVAETDELWCETGVTPLLLAISAVAIYLAVPDTEETAAFLGVVLPVALLGWPLHRGLARPGRRRCRDRAGGVDRGHRRPRRTARGARRSRLPRTAPGSRTQTRTPAGTGNRAGRSVEVVLAVVVIHGFLALVAAQIGAAHADLTRAVVVASVVVGASCLAGAWLSPPARDADLALRCAAPSRCSTVCGHRNTRSRRHGCFRSGTSPSRRCSRPPGRERVVEIGALRGETTVLMLERLGPDAELHVIDPVPEFDPAEHEQRVPRPLHLPPRPQPQRAARRCRRWTSRSIDGDHNWYTVYNELQLLAEVARARPARRCRVLILHDVGWPYGRRDLYYAPEQIPEEFRQPYAQAGMRPGTQAAAAEAAA